MDNIDLSIMPCCVFILANDTSQSAWF